MPDLGLREGLAPGSNRWMCGYRVCLRGASGAHLARLTPAGHTESRVRAASVLWSPSRARQLSAVRLRQFHCEPTQAAETGVPVPRGWELGVIQGWGSVRGATMVSALPWHPHRAEACGPGPCGCGVGEGKLSRTGGSRAWKSGPALPARRTWARAFASALATPPCEHCGSGFPEGVLRVLGPELGVGTGLWPRGADGFWPRCRC